MIKKDLKKYSKIFEQKDRLSQSKASKELVDKRRAMMEDYRRYREAALQIYQEHKSIRLELRGGVDTDELDSNMDGWEEETIEFFLINKEIILLGDLSQKSKNQKRFREAVQGEETRGGKVKRRRKSGGAEQLSQVSQVEVEEAVVHLQLHTGVSVRFLSSWKAFADHIAMTTKAIAETPFKSARDQTGFSFYLESEWAGGQRVDKAGKGLLQVWKRQIQQFNRVSRDMAAAILAAYPSPQLLKKAYSLCRTEHEQVSLLSDLLIRRGEGITSTTRRVGPELSKRLFLMMNFSNPEQTLDSNL